MNRIDYKKPGNIEKKILNILSDRDYLNFMSLRAYFSSNITFSLEKKCDDLTSLRLIKKERIDDDTQYSLTDQCAQVITRDFDDWIKFKVFDEIKNNIYFITKSTPSIERSTVKNLESNGKIYLDGNLYKVVPGQNLYAKKPSMDIPNKGGKINNIHPQNLLNKKAERTWKIQVNNWYNDNEVVIKIVLGIVAILGVFGSFI